jgi:hypothetical protein
MTEVEKKRILDTVKGLTSLELLRRRKVYLSESSVKELRKIISEERDESRLRAIPQ